jgi:micrococcal nuclease
VLRRRPRYRHDHRTHLTGVVTHLLSHRPTRLPTGLPTSLRRLGAGLALAGLAAVGVVVAGCESDGQPVATIAAGGALEANAVVEFVIDGDTIDVLIDGAEERVRLIGIDTPEVARRDGSAPAECFGPEATTFTESLLPVGTAVRLERDLVGRDDFGRLLAYVYRAEDGTFVNFELIRQGYATPLSIEPNTTFAAEFVDAARAAEADDLGLWRACSDATR